MLRYPNQVKVIDGGILIIFINLEEVEDEKANAIMSPII